MWHCIRRLNFNQMWTFGILENEWQTALILEMLASLHNFFECTTGLFHLVSSHWGQVLLSYGFMDILRAIRSIDFLS